MATKREELEKAARGEGCLGKAADDEPIFILRGGDRLAPQIIIEWAQRAARAGSPGPKVAEAIHLAARMLDWQLEHDTKVPD